MKFSKQAVNEIPSPESGRATYYDKVTQKLAVRVTQTGSKTFYVIKRTPAGMAWLKLGTFPCMTVEQARDAAEKYLGEFAKGNNPAQERRIDRMALSLREAFERYMSLHVAAHGIKTGADLRALWERCLGELPDVPAKRHGRKRTKHAAGVNWQNRKLNSIEPGEARALHAAIGATHPVLANRVMELVSAIYGRATYWGYQGNNPTAGLEPFREKKRDRFIQADELPGFFAALAEDTSEDFKHFVLLALLTGARRTNVLSARWEDVRLRSQTWLLRDTKNGERQTITLCPEAVHILEARGQKRSGFVFPAVSAAGHISPPKKRWSALLHRCGIEDLRLHDLRRTLGSWQAITGASLTIIGKSLGHKSADATMIYARLSLDPVRQSVDRATSAMLEAAGRKHKATVRPMKKVRP